MYMENLETCVNHVLVVDDEKVIREMVQQEIEEAGFQCSSVGSGNDALEVMDGAEVDVVITDIKMPGMSGIELTRRIQEKHNTDVIVMTGYAAGLNYERVIEIGASDFVQKPVSPKELLIRIKRVLRERTLLAARKLADEELKKSFSMLKRALDQTVKALTSTVEMRDPYTSGHQQRVTQIAVAIGNYMGLSPGTLDGIRIAGLLHDIGKISIPSEILSKPGRLTPAEFNLLKDHPQIGYEILETIEFPWPVAQMMIQHHERIDGSGYPAGLKDKEILLEAKILSVSDVVEAMSSHRPYRPSLGIEVALEEIERNKGKLYDRRVSEACLGLFREKKFSIEE